MKRTCAILMSLFLVFSILPAGWADAMRVSAADAEITTTKHTYSFKSNDGKTKPAVGSILDGTDTETSGILYMDAGSNSNGITFESNQLRFRLDSVLYLPIQADTTKVKYEQVCSNTNAGRPTYIGRKDSGYSVEMTNKATSVTVNDITDYIQEINGQKYLPIVSGGDVKIFTITLTEYNPVNAVTVSGHITGAAEQGITQLCFKNVTDPSAADIFAEIDAAGNYSVILKRVNSNTTYKVYVNAVGFKVNANQDADLIHLTGNGAAVTADFEIVADAPAVLSGSITGIPDDAVKSDLKISLVPENSGLLTVEVPVTKIREGVYTYSNIVIASNSNYRVEISGAEDYEISEPVSRYAGTYTDVDMAAALKARQTVSGEFILSDGGRPNVTEITFTSISNPLYQYTFAVTGDSYTALLRAGDYETSVVSETYTAFDHVQVGTEAVRNNVYLTAPENTTAVPYEENIKVGAGQRFETIRDAAAYVQRMTRTDAQRVTLQLTDAQYREQIVLDTPNVTIQSDTTATVTWYYGVGYSYFSANPVTRYYDEAYAVDQYEKNAISMVPGHWGATVNLSANAAGFRAENVVFENSFNRYMTAEEVEDGVGEGGDNAKVNRSKATDADIKKYANKERACTMFIEADRCEFNNCSFLSSQDTLFTGNGTESTYFKNCMIEGTTDYICGDGNAVFDNCTLSMYGYGDKAASGSIIVASKAVAPLGYLFKDCKITKTTYPGIDKGIVKTYLARPWRADSKVTFLNTEVERADTIAPAGYTSMSGVTPAQAKYAEHNTHLPDGTKVSTSSRASGVQLLTDAEAEAIHMTEYFGSWTPFYFQSDIPVSGADYTAVDAAVKRAEALNAEEYVDFTGVNAALAAVVRDLTSDRQAEVDAMARAIEEALDALVKKPVEPDLPPSGETEVDLEVGKDAPVVTVANTKEEIIDSVLTEEEKRLAAAGAVVKVTIRIADLTDSINETDKNIIIQAAGEDTIGQYLDLSLAKKVGAVETAVEQTGSVIKMEIVIPERLRNTDAAVNRTYQVIRLHNGVAVSLGGLYNAKTGTITFETDRFSAYAIAYKDVPIETETVTPGDEGLNEKETQPAPDIQTGADQTPATGDFSGIYLFLILLFVSGGTVLMNVRKKFCR